MVEQFNADFPEHNYSDKTEMSQDRKFMQSVEQSIQYKDGHYCIGLPFKNDPAKLPNNRGIAEQRAIGLKRKLSNNPKFYEDYKAFMTDITHKGYAEKCLLNNWNAQTECDIFHIMASITRKITKLELSSTAQRLN